MINKSFLFFSIIMGVFPLGGCVDIPKVPVGKGYSEKISRISLNEKGSAANFKFTWNSSNPQMAFILPNKMWDSKKLGNQTDWNIKLSIAVNDNNGIAVVSRVITGSDLLYTAWYHPSMSVTVRLPMDSMINGGVYNYNIVVEESDNSLDVCDISMNWATYKIEK